MGRLIWQKYYEFTVFRTCGNGSSGTVLHQRYDDSYAQSNRFLFPMETLIELVDFGTPPNGITGKTFQRDEEEIHEQ
jgi:hypothetical protein